MHHSHQQEASRKSNTRNTVSNIRLICLPTYTVENMECQFCKAMFDNLDEVQLHQAGTGCLAIEAGTAMLDITTETPADPIEVNTPTIPSTPEPTCPVTAVPPLHEVVDPSSVPDDASRTPQDANQILEDDVHCAESLRILASLCVDAPTNDIRNCIRLYKREKTYKQLKAAFNTCRKPVITSTLQYLGYSDENMNNSAKAECIHKLICIIQSLLPEDCDICKEMYVVQKNDPSLLACSICLQEVHYKCYQPLLVDHRKLMTIPGHIISPTREEMLSLLQTIIKMTYLLM